MSNPDSDLRTTFTSGKKWNVYWRGNKTPTVLTGPTIAEAFSDAGYGGGAVTAVDYYEEIQPSNWMTPSDWKTTRK